MYLLFKRLILVSIIFLSFLMGGSYFYSYIEGWRFIDSVYFTVITLTTIGYGDLFPQTDAGKIFTIFFSLIGVGIVFYFFSIIGKYVFRKTFESKMEEHRKKLVKHLERRSRKKYQHKKRNNKWKYS